MMTRKLTISEILDDLRVAEEELRRFERLYWLSSEQFYELYCQGLLDNGEYLHDYSQWAGYYKLRQRRLEVFNRFSREQVANWRGQGTPIHLEPREPSFEPVPA